MLGAALPRFFDMDGTLITSIESANRIGPLGAAAWF
jgi:phosphoserine phosphatase